MIPAGCGLRIRLAHRADHSAIQTVWQRSTTPSGLCASLGHELVEADLPGLDNAVGSAIGKVFNAATAWIVRYWIRRIGREPRADEIEPITRAYWQSGEHVSAAEYLEAIEDLQRFSRRVAEFLTTFDLWLTPTMSTPPAPLGEIVSSVDEPLRAAERGAPTVAYPAVVANITGNPAMSVPLWWSDSGSPIGVHFLARFGDEATLFRLAGQLEQMRPWHNHIPPVTARDVATVSVR